VREKGTGSLVKNISAPISSAAGRKGVSGEGEEWSGEGNMGLDENSRILFDALPYLAAQGCNRNDTIAN
jgi:hypothetical protein